MMWIIGILLIILFSVLLYRLGGNGYSVSPGEANSLEILKKRYARGEISEEEFKRRKRILQN